jgi:anti-sigma regulatory factor (Ser/Thr protein kinase)
MQYRSKLGIQIEFVPTQGSHGLFANIQPTEFKRLLSNLINNSVEAMGDHGKVEVRVSCSEDRSEIKLAIQDNGKGIPSEVLERVGSRGYSFEKNQGSGLGLFHARSSVEAWGGSLDIKSKLGSGTTVTLSIPTCAAPDWFQERLEIADATPVVVLDDDQSIHQIWKGRFESALLPDQSVPLFHFSTPEQLANWVHDQPTPLLKQTTFLLDYEIIGENATGLDAIERLGLGRRSVLVTSRYEEPAIRQRCSKLRVKLLPKALAGFVPLTIKSPLPQPDAVLVDDDSLVHSTWTLAARSLKKSFLGFKSREELLSQLASIAHTTPIYIDSNLGSSVKGEELILKLSQLGYQRLFLATGYDAHLFEHLKTVAGFQGVRDKMPPWVKGE